MMAGKENSAMTILMDFAKPCKGKLIGSVILAVLGALCGMIPYLAVSRGIIMICHEDYAFSKLAFLALIALAGYLGQVWFGTFSTMKSHESAFIILRNIRMAITEKLSRVPMGTILDTPSGKFKTIIVDTVEKLELPLAHMVPELTANILIPVLMLVYLFSLDWRLALISLVTIPVGAFCYMGMMKDYEKRYARVLAAGKNMDAATVEYIGGIEVVKTFNQGERSYKKYADTVAENETAKVTWFKQTNGYYVMGLSILTATLVGVLPLGSWLFINGRVEAGTLITCIILALGLVKPLIQALQYTDSLAMVDSTVKEVGNLLDEPELVRPTERAVLADTDVSFDHVTFRYKETEVLHGISFDCAKNGMTAIVGPSGSGKSTFTNRIKKRFGDDVVVLYHDNYYRRQDGIPFEQRVTVNYDHPDSLETELLVEHLKLLRQGKAIDCPVYDYSQHNRSDKILHITPSPVILVEGILLLADPRVRELLDIKVYVEADADERILRRISRDVEERRRDLNGIIKQYLNTVKPMHYLYVEPTRSKADIVINSGKNDVAFDLFVSKISMELEKRKQG